MVTLTSGAVSAIVPADVKQRLFDWLVDFTAQQAERLAGEEIGKRIKSWRSDGQMQRRVDAAIERAATRFLEQWPDQEIAQALASDTHFADLPSVRQGLRDLWRHPFDPAPRELLRGKFQDVLGKDADPQRVDAAVAGYLVQLRAELIGVPQVREVLAVMAQHETVVELRDIRTVLNQILSRFPEPPNLADLRQRLIDFLTDDCAWFDTRGLPQVREVVRLPLDEVYVPLSAQPTGLADLCELAREYVGKASMAGGAAGEEMPRERGQPRQMERVPAQSLLPLHRRLVILGEPGAGKTTLLRYVALMLARGQGAVSLGLAGDWLPILVPIQFFNEALREQRGDLSLADYLPRYFATRGVRGLGPLLEHELAQGRCVVLLDGLDEVLDPDHRAEVVARVADFLRAYRANRFIVTSRIAGYSDAPLDETFTLTTVLPFNDDEIRTFAHRWYRAYETRGEKNRAAAEETARRRAEALVEQIEDTPAVRRLAGNPLLLTILAVIHRQGTRLPAQRVELYRLCVEALAESWNRARSIGGRPIELNLGDRQLDEDYAVRFLAPVALRLHETSEGLIERGALRDQLQRLFQEDGETKGHARYLAGEFIGLIHRGAGLLAERGSGQYGFLHRTFEEYLAARWLTDFAEEPISWLRAHRQDPGWREVIRLAVAHKKRADASRLIRRGILAGPVPGPERGGNWVLAAECLMDLTEAKTDYRLRQIVLRGLRLTLADPTVPCAGRLAAGRALAHLGDPRPGVGLVSPPPRAGEGPGGVLPDIVWCEVPAGPFLMGSDKEKDPDAFDDELPQHEVILPTFYISRYPVTNAQFDAFVTAGGYRQERYWPEAAQAGVWKAGRVKGWNDDEPREGPYDFGVPFNLSNHPVVGVTWYEALAFCRWLEEQISELANQQISHSLSAIRHSQFTVRLPTEAQWEKAARGSPSPLLPALSGVEGAGETEGGHARIYPWGDEPDPDKANYVETGIRATSPVGCFPAGASPYGVLDMSGNVWEWCRTKWRENYQQPADDSLEGTARRVVRGGAFNYNRRSVRCAYRNRFFPDLRNWNFGFRVVVSHDALNAGNAGRPCAARSRPRTPARPAPGRGTRKCSTGKYKKGSPPGHSALRRSHYI